MKFQFIDPAKDFSDGLQVLYVYHDEFLAQGTRLLELVNDISKHGVNPIRANQCIHLHCFYTYGNLLHHQDEETALFPLIVKRSFLLDGMVERLALDHEEIEEDWSRLASQLGRPEHIKNFDELTELATDFEKSQREHLLRENEDFFPEIKNLLTPDQLAQMGKTMAGLRQIRS